MESLGVLLKHPDEIIPLLKLIVLELQVKKGIQHEPHWVFCHNILYKIYKRIAIANHELKPELRDAVCVFYLVLKALDTIEDDTSIPTDVKVPILIDFHKHIYDRDWHFPCGTGDCKVLMDELQQVLTAFSELETGYQKVIQNLMMNLGVGMVKYIDKEIETTEEYYEYCLFASGLAASSLSQLFHITKLEDLTSDNLPYSTGMLVQQTDIITDYLEDINELPKSRIFWPRDIWSKYVNSLEDLKHEENSVKALECLNEMVTNALLPVEDCLHYMTTLEDAAIFRMWAVLQISIFGKLALSYNNINIFRSAVKMRRGLLAKIIDRTKSMSDVYDAFFYFSSVIKDKVDKNDPNAVTTLSRIEVIQKICRDSGALNRRSSYDSKSSLALIIVPLIAVSCIIAYLLTNRNMSFVRGSQIASRGENFAGCSLALRPQVLSIPTFDCIKAVKFNSTRGLGSCIQSPHWHKKQVLPKPKWFNRTPPTGVLLTAFNRPGCLFV